MFQNTKLLIVFSFLIIFSGLGLLWFGTNTMPSVPASPQPSIVSSPPVSVSGASSSAAIGVEGERAKVFEVVDGDTIKVDLAGKEYTVRYVGMDTPETVDPRRPVGCFGKEASNENK